LDGIGPHIFGALGKKYFGNENEWLRGITDSEDTLHNTLWKQTEEIRIAPLDRWIYGMTLDKCHILKGNYIETADNI
jgi:hypothetical protein